MVGFGKFKLVVANFFDCLMLSKPLYSQVKVNGPKAAPVYNFLKASKGGWFGSRIKWNFTKFLVDKDGNVIKRYGTTTTPLAIEVLYLPPLSLPLPALSF